MSNWTKGIFLVAALTMTCHASFASVFTPGPQDAPSPPGHNYPRWYVDPVRGAPPPTGGLPLELCLSQTPSPTGLGPMCVLLSDGPPDTFITTNPISFTTNAQGQFNGNFPAESFYFIADAIILDIGGGNRARYRAALEAAFGSGLPQPGQQISFARVRWDVDAPVNGTYRITHPFGQRVFSNVVAGPAAINIQEDVGVGNPGGPFTPITTTDQPDGNLGQFLVRSGAPGGQPALITIGNEVFIGDPNTDQNVTGATFPDPANPGQFFNAFRVEIDTNNDGIYDQVFTTDNFALAGKVIGFSLSPAAGNDFSVLKLGVAGTPKNFTVTNLSTASVTPTVTSSNPEFAVGTDNCSGAPLASAASCTFAVTFTPVATDGPRTSTLTVSGTGLPSATLAVSGIGDNTLPVVALSAPTNNSFTNDTTPLLTYAITDANPNPAATVVTVDGTPVNPTPASGASLATLGDGVHTVRVDATDLAGNTDFTQNSFTVDTVPPTASISAPAASSLINTRTPVLTYTAADAVSLATTVVKVDDVVVNPTPTSGANLASLADGAHAVRVEVTDSAGNTSFAVSSFNVDATAPVIAITGPVNLSITADSTPQILFSVSDANPNSAATVVKVDGAVVAKVSGDSLAALADGQHVLRIEATDSAGNSSALESTFIVDTTAPVPLISSPANSAFTSDPGPLLTFAITDANPATSVVRLDGNVVAIPTGQHLPNLPDGQHRVRVDHTDAAGNTGFAEAVFVVDTTSPVVSISSPAVGLLTGDTTPQLLFTATDTNSPTVVVKVDGTTVNVASGQSLPTLADGTHLVRIEVTDAAGNLSFTEASFTVDSAFPIIDLTSPVNLSITRNTNPVLTFSASDSQGIAATVVKINGAVVQKNSGDPLGPLSEGLHTIRVEVTDNAGNTAVAISTITIDTTPPAVAGVSSITNRTSLIVSGTVEAGITPVTTVRSGGGTLGAVTVLGTSWTLPLSTLTAGTNIVDISATDVAGNTATTSVTITYVLPDGDSDGSGGTTILDALRVLRHVGNQTPLNGTNLLKVDVAPLLNGVPSPDNVIDIGDAALILRKAAGLISSF